MEPPVLDVFCFEKLPDEMEKPLVCNAFTQYPQERIVVDMIERSSNEMPCSRTQKMLGSPTLTSRTRSIRSTGAASRSSR
jgi:hypothetical protein